VRGDLARIGALACLLALAGCTPDRALMRESAGIAAKARETTTGCVAHDTCARATPLAELVVASRAAAAMGAPAHRLVLLPRGEDSLALRLHLLRSARERIELQTFILSDDDSGLAVIDELVAAARRGVKVRILSDQLFSTDNTALLARLAQVHDRLAMRLYNPTFGEARTGKLEFAAGILCCFSNFNQRMHNKLLLVDGAVAVIGGRNVDDRYFDWGADFIYRDRDVLVVGPVAADMAASFEAFWVHPRAVPVERLGDVAQRIVAEAGGAEAPAPEHVADPQRLARVLARADDVEWVRREFVQPAFAVDRVEYFADQPDKRFERDADNRDLSARIAALLGEARERIVLQTPYLVLSREARKLLKAKRAANPALELVVSTNSLAATDAFYVYAVSQKYKRYFVRALRMQIYEYRPFPGDPDDMADGVGVDGTAVSRPRPKLNRREPVPLARPGMRRGMHAKSIVIDRRIAMIGSHNFDPRSDDLNTENGLIVWDPAFARAVEADIALDILPQNAWVIAPRALVPGVTEVNSAIATVSEELPFFDLWPFRYATSWQLKPGATPVGPYDPSFGERYEPVGDFPEVAVSMKHLYTRILIAFGLGLAPIL
jgi:phosphatidylserine/phosphatidylglycerophosphate/cardiolipin synthase-like enzyme